MKNGYDNGRVNVNLKSGESNYITVYGKSNCSVSSGVCDYTYFGYTKVEDYFTKHMVCANGETSIGFSSDKGNVASAAYKGAWTGSEDVEAYWTEVYEVKCLTNISNNTLGSSTTLENSGTSSDGSGNVSGDFPSSDGTVENEDTGVFTYYVVLLVIALGSYVLLLMSKKHNLFKKI